MVETDSTVADLDGENEVAEDAGSEKLKRLAQFAGVSEFRQQ